MHDLYNASACPTTAKICLRGQPRVEMCDHAYFLPLCYNQHSQLSRGFPPPAPEFQFPLPQQVVPRLASPVPIVIETELLFRASLHNLLPSRLSPCSFNMSLVLPLFLPKLAPSSSCIHPHVATDDSYCSPFPLLNLFGCEFNRGPPLAFRKRVGSLYPTTSTVPNPLVRKLLG